MSAFRRTENANNLLRLNKKIRDSLKHSKNIEFWKAENCIQDSSSYLFSTNKLPLELVEDQTAVAELGKTLELFRLSDLKSLCWHQNEVYWGEFLAHQLPISFFDHIPDASIWDINDLFIGRGKLFVVFLDKFNRWDQLLNTPFGDFVIKLKSDGGSSRWWVGEVYRKMMKQSGLELFL
jgi:hypothetical protein